MIIVETLERLARRLPSGRPPPFFKTNFSEKWRRVAAGGRPEVRRRVRRLSDKRLFKGLDFTVGKLFKFHS